MYKKFRSCHNMLLFTRYSLPLSIFISIKTLKALHWFWLYLYSVRTLMIIKTKSVVVTFVQNHWFYVLCMKSGAASWGELCWAVSNGRDFTLVMRLDDAIFCCGLSFCKFLPVFRQLLRQTALVYCFQNAHLEKKISIFVYKYFFPCCIWK